MQVIHLIVITIFIYLGAQAAKVSVWQYVKTQSQMGRGIPLVGLKKQKIKEWRYDGPELSDTQILQLSSALRQNRTVERVKMTNAFGPTEVRTAAAGVRRWGDRLGSGWWWKARDGVLV